MYWMIKLDLKNAYLQIPIHTDHQHLLQFHWGNKTYQFRCLPFRLTSAPQVFSKIMKLVVRVLLHMGIRLIIDYLGDLLVLHQSMEELAQLTLLICQLFNLEFLGFHVDTVILQLIFPAKKLRKIQQLAQHLIHQPNVLVRDLARFVGKTSAST